MIENKGTKIAECEFFRLNLSLNMLRDEHYEISSKLFESEDSSNKRGFLFSLLILGFNSRGFGSRTVNGTIVRNKKEETNYSYRVKLNGAKASIIELASHLRSYNQGKDRTSEICYLLYLGFNSLISLVKKKIIFAHDFHHMAEIEHELVCHGFDHLSIALQNIISVTESDRSYLDMIYKTTSLPQNSTSNVVPDISLSSINNKTKETNNQLGTLHTPINQIPKKEISNISSTAINHKTPVSASLNVQQNSEAIVIETTANAEWDNFELE